MSTTQPERPAVTRRRIVDDLRALGVTRGMLLCVHSSLRSLGQVEGGAPTAVSALLEAIGPEGTLVMPAFTEPAPTWDQAATPSRTGAITEAFRTTARALRSANPTHSVAALGPRAAEIVEGHRGADALAVDSPLHRLAKWGGSVLMIGCDYRTCSLIHVAESLARVPYLDIPYTGYGIEIEVILADGGRRVYRPAENPGDSSAFGRVEQAARERGLLRDGTVGAAPCILARGNDILITAMELICQDPGAVLCARPDCKVCAARLARVAKYRAEMAAARERIR